MYEIHEPFIDLFKIEVDLSDYKLVATNRYYAQTLQTLASII